MPILTQLTILVLVVWKESLFIVEEILWYHFLKKLFGLRVGALYIANNVCGLMALGQIVLPCVGKEKNLRRI